MHMPSITTDCLAVLVLACTALTPQMGRSRYGGRPTISGGILLSVGLAVSAALPIVSRLPWADFADEIIDRAVATLQFLEAAYVILTL